MTRSSKPSDAAAAKGSKVERVSLREVVREALMAIITDKSASAAAKASAGRTLLEHFGDEDGGAGGGRRSTELSAGELDAEIARLTPRTS